MATLRVVAAGAGPGDQAGEVLACNFTSDGAFVLSGGWDGHLRLWETAFAAHVTALRVGTKPVSACCCSPDGKYWLAGTLDGLLSHWDALSHQQVSVFLAHPRPVSAIVFGIDETTLATAAWDGQVILWDLRRERSGRALSGHRDIVSGCQFTPDGQTLVSWSYDATLRTWEMARARPLTVLTGHPDRITAGAVSRDGRFAASGSRDASVKLWDLRLGRELASTRLGGEVRSCLFLLDGQTLAAIDFSGRITLHRLPSLEIETEQVTHLPVHCAALSPSGAQIALGCSDGRLRFVAVDGYDSEPLVVTALQTSQRRSGILHRMLGRGGTIHTFHCVCPACRQSFQLPGNPAGQPEPCPNCRRPLRVAAIARTATEPEARAR